MLLEWREREHEALDTEVMESDAALEALRLCGLKKIFEMNSMRAQPRMLEMLVGYWDPDVEAFMLDCQPLRIEVEDIYFLTGLSPRGMVASLKDRNIGGLMVYEYMPYIVLQGQRKLGLKSRLRISSGWICVLSWPPYRGS